MRTSDRVRGRFTGSESARDEEAGESHRDQVFEQSDESIFDVQRDDQTLPDFVIRQYLEAKHDHRTVVKDEQARYFGTTLEKGSLVPAGKSLLGSCRFADWLSRTAQQK
jgi:hypothetical protein